MTIAEVVKEMEKITKAHFSVSYEVNRYENGKKKAGCQIYLSNPSIIVWASTFQLVWEKLKNELGLTPSDKLGKEEAE